MKSKTPEYRAEYWLKYRREHKPYSSKPCIICGETFTKCGSAKRCPDCRHVTCVYCGKKFKPPASNYKRKFCNRECKAASLRGVEPPALAANRGVKPRTYHVTHRDKHGSAMDCDWRGAIFLRDNYTCQECGQVGGRLQAHHVKSWKTHPDLRHELSNGQTLCVECHKKTDSYGGKNAKKANK